MDSPSLFLLLSRTRWRNNASSFPQKDERSLRPVGSAASLCLDVETLHPETLHLGQGREGREGRGTATAASGTGSGSVLGTRCAGSRSVSVPRVPASPGPGTRLGKARPGQTQSVTLPAAGGASARRRGGGGSFSAAEQRSDGPAPLTSGPSPPSEHLSQIKFPEHSLTAETVKAALPSF